MVANFLGGGAVCNAFAGQVGAEVCVVDVGVATELPATPGLLPRKIRAGTSDMTTGPAMTREEAKQAIEVGIETARDLVAAGNKALLTGEMGIANTTASAALISVYTDTDPAEVTGRGTGINDETLARKTEVVRRAVELHQPDPADPIGVLAAVGGFEHAAMVGLLLGGASLRTPVILDGVSAGAAALVARAIAPEVLAACIAGHRSAEPGHVAALNKLGLRPWSTSTSGSARAPARCSPCRWCRARHGPCTRWRPSTRRASPRSSHGPGRETHSCVHPAPAVR